MPPIFYVRAGIYVERVEVREDNLDSLAARHGGRVDRGRSQRPAWVVDHADGALTIPVGGVAVAAVGDGEIVDGFSDPREFESTYSRAG